MKDLKGKVAFVTGGNSGIGLGIARQLAAEGMKVAITYRREDHLKHALGQFRADGREDQVLPVKLDVTDREAYARAADEVEAKLGPVKVLVNNAGIGVGGLVEQATYDDWDWVMEVNVGGVVNGIVTFLPRMVAAGDEAHIVNVSSMGGIAALGSVGLYATSKFAVLGLTEAIRTDMLGRPISASVYLPGPVKSNIGEGAASRPAKYSETGYAMPDPVAAQEGGEVDGPPPVDLMATAMEALDAGRYVVDGIKQNKLFIFSHPEFGEVIKARNRLIEASIPDEPINQARFEAWNWIMSNPVYSEGA